LFLADIDMKNVPLESERQGEIYRAEFEANYKDLKLLSPEMREQLFRDFVARKRRREAALPVERAKGEVMLTPFIDRSNDANRELAQAVDSYRKRFGMK
jgi:hypothetical protein